MKKPLLVYDGDCGFCRRWAARWRALTGDAAAFETYQEAAARFPQVPREAFEGAVQWFGPDGRAEGADAVFRLLALSPRHRWWLAAYRRLPGFAALSEAIYRFVAARRAAFSRLDRLLWGESPLPPDSRAAFRLLLRLLGLVHLVAFASLWVQLDGLWGARGILPAGELLAAARAQLGGGGWRYLPSVFWLGAADASLRAACAAGLALSVVVMLGYAVAPALLALWALYLSFVSVGREFMSFQWDILLLEATLLLAWSAPWRLKPDWSRWRPPAAGVWLTRLLVFRLMLESGWVKLASGDPRWRDLTALAYHYWSQPLPPWTAWYADRLPLLAQKACCAALFAVELGAPWLILLPRRPRLLGFWLLVGLQTLIALTGNYGFFNPLAVVLCLSLVDGVYLPALPERDSRAPAWSALPCSVLLLLVFWQPDAVRPFFPVNRYGLFAVMTTQRREIVLEGSADGREWKPYEFKWKPGEVTRRPRFVEPHMPRLDWQMWFAALGTCRDNPWFVRFMVRLLQGDPAVSGLLARDPFAGGPPPRYLRSTLYDYRFAPPGSDAWWTRRALGPYCPPISLRGQ